MDQFTVSRALLEGLISDDFRISLPAHYQTMVLLNQHLNDDYDPVAEGDADWCIAALKLRKAGWAVSVTGLANYAYYFKDDHYGPLYPSEEAAWRALAQVVEVPEEEEPETLEYSVCEDCLMVIANGEAGENVDLVHLEAAMKRELGGRNGHFMAGVSPTEEDPEGTGFDEFSGCACELCNDTLAGSRHGVTLLFTEEDNG